MLTVDHNQRQQGSPSQRDTNSALLRKEFRLFERQFTDLKAKYELEAIIEALPKRQADARQLRAKTLCKIRPTNASVIV